MATAVGRMTHTDTISVQMNRRVRRRISMILSLLIILMSSLLDTCHGLRTSTPYLNNNSINITRLNYTRLMTDAEQLQMLLYRTTYLAKPIEQALARYSPYSEYLTVGPLLFLDPNIYLGLKDEFLCEPPPSRMDLNPTLLQDRGTREFYPPGPLLESDSRWKDFNATASVAGAILVVSRGQCSFMQKSFFAQYIGAAGLIVTNYWVASALEGQKDVLKEMDVDDKLEGWLRREGYIGENEQLEMKIPSIFITRSSWTLLAYAYIQNILNQCDLYQNIQLRLWQQANPDNTTDIASSTGGSSSDSVSDSSTGSSAESSTDSSSTGSSVLRRLLQQVASLTGSDASTNGTNSTGGGDDSKPYVPSFRYVPMLAAIDSSSSDNVIIVTEGNYDSFRIAAYFLLVLPSLWCLVAMMYVARRCGVRYREKRRRETRNKLIPTVKYHILTPEEIRSGKFRSIITNMERDGDGDGNDGENRNVTSTPSPPIHSPIKKVNVLSDSSASSPFLQPFTGSRANESKEDREQGGVEMHSILVHPSSSSTVTRDHPPPISSMGDDASVYPVILHSDPDPAARMSPAAALVMDVDENEDEEKEHRVAAHPLACPSGQLLSASSSTQAGPIHPLGIGISSSNKPLKIVGTSCAVCLCDYEDGETLSLLPCSHAFHPHCISPWLERSDECAVCRASVMQAADDALALANRSRCADWCCPVTTPRQRQEAQRRQTILRARNARQNGAAATTRASNVQRAARLAAAAASTRATSSSSAARRSPDGHELLPSRPTHISAVQLHTDTSVSQADSSSSSASSPAIAMSSTQADSLYGTTRVKESIAEFLHVLEPDDLPDQEREVDAALLELKLTAEEYVQTYGPSTQPVSLSDEHALLLLAQLQAELGVIASHCAERQDLAEATFMCESALQYAHEIIARRMKQTPTPARHE